MRMRPVYVNLMPMPLLCRLCALPPAKISASPDATCLRRRKFAYTEDTMQAAF
jgi:hypothetical protein